MTIIAVVLFVVPSNTRGISGAFALGLLLAQYTIAGFDASAHVSEETRGARTEAPKAIVRSIYIPAIAGLILNLALIATVTASMPASSSEVSFSAVWRR